MNFFRDESINKKSCKRVLVESELACSDYDADSTPVWSDWKIRKRFFWMPKLRFPINNIYEEPGVVKDTLRFTRRTRKLCFLCVSRDYFVKIPFSQKIQHCLRTNSAANLTIVMN